MQRRPDADELSATQRESGGGWPGAGSAAVFLAIGIGLVAMAFGGFGHAVNGGTVAGIFGLACLGCGGKIAADVLRRWRERVTLGVMGRHSD